MWRMAMCQGSKREILQRGEYSAQSLITTNMYLSCTNISYNLFSISFNSNLFYRVYIAKLKLQLYLGSHWINEI